MAAELSTPTRRTQTERRLTAESRLVQAAAELISEQGAAQTSLAEIGARAGFSRGIVNHHFGSKAELLNRLVMRAQDDFVRLRPTPGPDALGNLIELSELYLRSLIPGNAVTRAFVRMWAESVGHDELRQNYIDADRRFRALLRKFVSQGVEQGSISPSTSPTGLAAVLVGQLRGLVLLAQVDPKAIQRVAVITQVRANLEALRPV
jgi:AcrR family transcriptional regulator